MEQTKIDRINALARAARERELSEDEKAEQQALRKEYIGDYKRSLKAHLDSIVVVDQHGTKTPLKPKDTTLS